MVALAAPDDKEVNQMGWLIWTITIWFLLDLLITLFVCCAGKLGKEFDKMAGSSHEFSESEIPRIHDEVPGRDQAVADLAQSKQGL